MSKLSVLAALKRLLVLLVVSSIVGFGAVPANAEAKDFSAPYGNVRPVVGERPLLVILLQPPDARMRSDINLYALRENGTILQTSFSEESGWWGPTELPAMPRFTSAPAVLDSPDGQTQSVFARAQDGYIYQTSISRFIQTDSWQSWVPLPKTQTFASAPAALNSPDGTMASVFALGTDGFIYQSVFTGGPGGRWGAWMQHPRKKMFVSAPAALNSPDGTMASLFALGTDGYFYQSVFIGGPGGDWGEWTPLPEGQQFTSAPAALNSPDGTMASVFALATDGYIYQSVFTGGPSGSWGAWTPVRKTRQFASAPAAMNSPDGTVARIFALGVDGNIYQSVFTGGPGGRWGDWVRSPGDTPFQSAPAVAPRPAPIKTVEEYRRIIFGSTNSVRSYYLENSYGKFTFKEAYITRWLTAQDDPSTRDVDESSFNFIHGPLQERKGAWAIQQVERYTPFRFNKYDANHDGMVTSDELGVLWIYPGGGDARGRQTEPAAVPVPSLTRGVRLDLLVRGGSWMSMATIAHELAHQALHLDDLYPDQMYPGVGQLSLMGDESKSAHLDPWAKMKLGWLTPTVVTGDGWYTLNDVETHPTAYILHDPRYGRHEYFMVENRWPGNSFEQPLGAGGLAIWHIDERYANSANWGRKTISLVPADGIVSERPTGDLWDGARPLTGYNLSPTSQPASARWNDRSSSQIGVYCVPRSGSTVQVFFDIPPLASAPPACR